MNLRDNNVEVGLSDFLYVKLKRSSDFSLLQEKALEKKLTIVEQNRFMPLWYTLRCTHSTIGNSLQIANYLFETNLFSSAIPDLLTNDLSLCTNDTQFGDLWGLNNSSNPNIDINACEAWSITEGSGVNVAVLDQGIELTHNDLVNNISPLSYDTESNSSPSKIFGWHGTHCAGTIGAVKDNNLQAVGVAPQCTLFSISNSLIGRVNSRIKRADGINWAVQNGVDIISNSWGSGVQFDVIDDAIENALTNGRNNKGTIVVFAAGNNNGRPVSYPANSNEDILAVGSITSSGTRSSFSNIGNKLDLVAPGSNVFSTVLNNETESKSGTSFAAPHVAGVAALILSVNPNLTVQQVNDIIESTAQKTGSYNYTNNSDRSNGTWNNEMGYGLVDAYASARKAKDICTPLAENISITTSESSNILPVGSWVRLSAYYNGNSNNDYRWEWRLPPMGLAKYSKNDKRSYVNFMARVIALPSPPPPLFSSRPPPPPHNSDRQYINIDVEVRATSSCGVVSEWHSKTFKIESISGLPPN